MHKILAASTTALLLVTTAPAFGDVQIPQISLSGATALNLHLFRNKIRNLDGGTGRGHHLAIESSNLNIEAEGQAEEFDYGVKIKLSTQSNEENSISENRLKIKGDWGTFYGGNTDGIERKSAQGGFRIMGATGGFGGKMTRTYLPATGTSISVSMAGDTSYRTKVFYYTPRFQGFQLGVSLTPETRHKGDDNIETSSVNAKKGAGYGKNVVSTSLTYEKTLESDMTVKLSAIGLRGNAVSGDKNNSTVRSLMSWAVGGVLSWRGFSLGAEYVDNGKSLVNKTDFSGNNAGKFYDIAAGYSFGKNSVALGYYSFKAKNGSIVSNPRSYFTTKGFTGGEDLGTSKAQVVSFTYDRSIVPGLKMYGEANYYDTQTTLNRRRAQEALKSIKDSSYRPAIPSNHGHSVIVGTKLSF